MTKAAHSSGKPAYCSGAGNATMIYDETAIPAEAARNTRISKTSDFGSGCSADGNIIISDAIYDETVKALIAEGGVPGADKGFAVGYLYECSEDGTVEFEDEPAYIARPRTS